MKFRLLLFQFFIVFVSYSQTTGLFSSDHVSEDSLFIIDHLGVGAITGILDNDGDDWMALGYDIDNQKVYGFSSCAGFPKALYSFSLYTLQVDQIALLNNISVYGADFDNNNDILYAVGMPESSYGVEQTLYTFNTTSGTGTAIGELDLLGDDGFCSASGEGINGLAYDTDLNTLWGFSSNKLYNIDPSNGAATLIGSVDGGGSLRGGAYDIQFSKLYAISQNETVYEIDKTNGNVVSTILPQGEFSFVTGLAYVTAPCTPPANPSVVNLVQPGCVDSTGSFSISSPLGSNIQYGINGVFQSNPSFTNIEPGTYNVVAKDTVTGCISGMTIVSIVPNLGPPDNAVAILEVSPSCANPFGTILINSPLGTDLVYIVNNAAQSNNVVSGLNPGEYLIIVQNTTNLCISDTISIVIPAAPIPPTVSVVGDQMIDEGQTTLLVASGAENYFWFPDSTLNILEGDSVSANPIEDTEYCFIGEDANGCSDTACILVEVNPICPEPMLPNVFSPNQDAFNEWVEIKTKSGCITSSVLNIYNRWGELVFESNDLTKKWDGIYKGKNLSNGIYFYTFNYTLKTSQRLNSKKGSITLVR